MSCTAGPAWSERKLLVICGAVLVACAGNRPQPAPALPDEGFVVDQDRMVVVVRPQFGCSARGYSFELRWNDVQAILDPRGPMVRLREGG